MSHKPLDTVADKLVLVGTYKKFSICYDPTTEQWHGILPTSGEIALVPSKALAHYSDLTRERLLERLDRHRFGEFQRFRVLRAPPLLPDQRTLFPDSSNTIEQLEITSEAGEGQYWAKEVRTGNRLKIMLEAYYADTATNRGRLQTMLDISLKTIALQDEYNSYKQVLQRATPPAELLDTILGS